MIYIFTLIKIVFVFITLHIAMYIKVMDDFFKISNGLHVCHSEGAGLNTLLFSILSLLLFKNPIDMITCFLAMAIYCWILFDIWLNKVRGLDINYVGRKAFTDRLLKFIGIKNIIYVKLFFLVIIFFLRFYLF